MDERLLAERLITYDTSKLEGLRAAAGFVKGWLGSQDIDVEDRDYDGLPVILADVGAREGPTLDPARPSRRGPGPRRPVQPRVEGDRLIGRGAYDMKGALAAMMCAVRDVADQDAVRVRFVCVPDEESEDVEDRSTDALVEGRPARRLRDHRRADRPAHRRPGQGRARRPHRGRRARRPTARRRGSATTRSSRPTTSSGGSRRCRSAASSSDLFDRPSINLARIVGGDAFNKVPDACTMDVDIRYLPNQDPGDDPGPDPRDRRPRIVKTFIRAPAIVSRTNPYVRALREAVGRLDRGRRPQRRPRRRLRRGRRSWRRACRRSSSGPSAAATTARTSGSRSLARRRTARRSADFVRGLPAWLEQARVGPRCAAVERRELA